MKHRLTQIVVAAAVMMGSLSVAQAADSDQAKIRTLLKTYEQALSASDVAGVVKLYTKDGVFMPQHSPSVVGIDAIEAAYEAVFKAIDLEVEFDIAEIALVTDDWAFARTNSAGTTTINVTGDKVAEANQELFVLQKTTGGDWKIARYSFSTTKAR